MEKKFNITGTCIPNKHYMVDISNKLEKVIELIANEEYFIINRPRQYGKTTTLLMLEKALEQNDEYLVISTSFEGIGDLIFEDESKFSNGFLKLIQWTLLLQNENLSKYIGEQATSVLSMFDLSYFITNFIKKADKKVILMIDEVDKSSNNQIFLSFLGMLRNKYLLRNAGKDSTFHSVILAGVHDVKSLKSKIRPNEEQKYNSPWNIASDFNVDMSFSITEISTMLDDYVNNKIVKLDKDYFSEKLYYYTSGYPFLVSKLCKIIDESLMNPENFEWEKRYIDLAVKELLKENNTNFESLIKNLENNTELYNLARRIILDGENITYVRTDEILNLATIYGVFKEENGICKVNNRIYEQLIYNHMMIKIIRQNKYASMSDYNFKSYCIDEDGSLNIKKVLIKFQEFMKHEYSDKRQHFLEEDRRLLFLAFLSPIINGKGFAFKEVKGGEEKRFDIVITYGEKINILELKIWRGEEYHKKGLIQLSEYLDQYGLAEGYLLIFDFRKLNKNDKDLKEITVCINEKSKMIVEAYC